MSRTTLVALAWALIHFLWQGAAVALAAGVAGAALRRARATTRYAVLCGALGVMALAPIATFIVLRLPRDSASLPRVAATMAPLLSPLVSFDALSTPPLEETAWLEWVVAIWLSGVTVLGLRSLGGWMWAQRLTRWKTSPAAAEVQRLAMSVQERLGIRRAVRIVSTAIAEVPTTIGWIKPVVLFPVSAVTSLTSEQIELLIAHELAHVRRHDYLVNLVQTAIETALFYHPAVWWIGGRIREERENCCDDLAVAACGDVALYVRTLAALEGLRMRRTGVVLAADGGSLLQRIRRLASPERPARRTPRAWLGALVPAAIVLAAVVSVPSPRVVATPSPDSRQQPDAGTSPASDRAHPASATLAHDATPREDAPTHDPARQSDESTNDPSLPVGAPKNDPATLFRATDARDPAPPAEAPATSNEDPALPADVPVPDVASPAEAIAHGDDPHSSTQDPAPSAAGASTPSRNASTTTGASSGKAEGFLGGLAESGYPRLSVDEIIALKEHGVEPRYVKELLQAGLGVPSVRQMISLHDNGVEPGFVAGMVKSGFVSDLDFESVIRLRHNDARGDDMGRIRALGFGPYPASDVIKLRQNGVDVRSFEALKEAGAGRADADDAIVFRHNDVTTERIRDMKRQGFHDLSLEQILKLRRAGII